MKAEIITIGDELLIGQVIDTNSAWIAEKLNQIGIEVQQIISISDTKEAIIKTLNLSFSNNAELVIMTGGLGPTNDDITKKVLADYFHTALTVNMDVLKNIERIFKERGYKMNDLNSKQAEVPENCTALHNANGTAPGMWFKKERKTLISIPGVPYEVYGIMEDEILPRLQKSSMLKIIHKVVLVQGIAESHLAERLNSWEKKLPESIKLAYLPSPGRIRLRLSAKGKDKSLLNNLLDKTISSLEKLIPEFIYGYDQDSLESIIGKLLTDKGLTIATAESCTGGNIASSIVSIPGSSAYFIGSIVAYSNEIKEKVLHVNPKSIIKNGVVSKEIVEEMSKGIINLFNVDFAVATSGIAGPEGGSPEKPVGTTWITVASKETVISEKYIFGNDRERNIQKTTYTALNMLRKLIIERDY